MLPGGRLDPPDPRYTLSYVVAMYENLAAQTTFRQARRGINLVPWDVGGIMRRQPKVYFGHPASRLAGSPRPLGGTRLELSTAGGGKGDGMAWHGMARHGCVSMSRVSWEHGRAGRH